MSFDLYTSLVFVHLLAATVLVGSSLFTPLTRAALRRAPTTGDARSWLDFQRRMVRFNPLAAAVTLGTGVYLGSVGWWHQGWFHVSVAIFVASSLVAAVGLHRLEVDLERALAGDPGDPVPPAADRARRSRAWDLAGGFLLAADLVLLLVMVRKPSLATSLVLLGGAVAVAALVALQKRADTATAAGDTATPAL